MEKLTNRKKTKKWVKRGWTNKIKKAVLERENKIPQIDEEEKEKKNSKDGKVDKQLKQ